MTQKADRLTFEFLPAQRVKSFICKTFPLDSFFYNLTCVHYNWIQNAITFARLRGSKYNSC